MTEAGKAPIKSSRAGRILAVLAVLGMVSLYWGGSGFVLGWPGAQQQAPSQVRQDVFSFQQARVFLDKCAPDQKLTFILNGVTLHPPAIYVHDFSPLPEPGSDVCSRSLALDSFSLAPYSVVGEGRDSRFVTHNIEWWVSQKLPGSILVSAADMSIKFTKPIGRDEPDRRPPLARFEDDYAEAVKSQDWRSYGTPTVLTDIDVPDGVEVVKLRWGPISYLALKNGNKFDAALDGIFTSRAYSLKERIYSHKLDLSGYLCTVEDSQTAIDLPNICYQRRDIFKQRAAVIDFVTSMIEGGNKNQ